MTMTKKRRSPAGFSILEILVVLTIVSFLLAILVPIVTSAQARASQARCLNSMRQIGLAFRAYQNDNKGMFPNISMNANENWQSYLGDPTYGGIYLSGNMMTSDGWGNRKFSTSFICPTMARRGDFNPSQEWWGFSINVSRVGISYGAPWPPWGTPEHLGADLDEIYLQSSRSAVLTDGNYCQWWDGDWDAFTSSAFWIWGVQPVHNEGVNILFLDGHIAFAKVITAAEKDEFNRLWHSGVPSTMGNPW